MYNKGSDEKYTLKNGGTISISESEIKNNKITSIKLIAVWEKDLNSKNAKKKGTVIKDTKTNASYVVTSNTGKNPTVKFTGTTNKNATSITIPATIRNGGITYKVTEINSKALKGNKKVVTIKIGNNVTKIGDEAFSGCTALTNLIIGSNVTTIGNNAFYNTALKNLTLPAKVTRLGKQFIGKTRKLKTLIFKSTKLTKNTVSANACSGIGKSVVIKVPKSKVNAYTKLFQNKGLEKKVKVKANK